MLYTPHTHTHTCNRCAKEVHNEKSRRKVNNSAVYIVHKVCTHVRVRARIRIYNVYIYYMIHRQSETVIIIIMIIITILIIIIIII